MSQVTSLRSYIDPYSLLPDFINEARKDPAVEEISADGNGIVTTAGHHGRQVIGSTTHVQRKTFLNAAASAGLSGGSQDISSTLLFSEAHPFLSVTLPDGERLEGQHEVLSPDGCSFSLRKFSRVMRLHELTEQGMMTKEQEEFLRSSVGKANILVAGGTRSGKTHLLKALLEEVQQTTRWFAIEKTTELQRPIYGNRVQVNKVTTFEDAFQSAKRYDPTLIVISEINSRDSALAYVEAAISGHYGMSTVHARNADMVKMRIMMRLVGFGIPSDYVDEACQVIVHIGMDKDRDNKRFVTKIIGMEDTE